MKIQTQDKLKFAVVGCGHIGKRHAAMIQRNEECTLVALCDIKPREELQLDTFEAAFFTSIEELLAAPLQIDIVCICTPNAFHASQGILVLEAKKHLVCEKPMALSKADCEAMIFKALNVSKQVFCVMQNRYSPPAVWLKSIIDENRLGKTFMVQINCYWNRDDRYYLPHQNATSPAEKRHAWHGSKALDGGTLFTQFSHFIDIMYWLFGDIQDVNAQLADFAHQHSTDFEDSGIVNFKFVNGGMGSINYSTAAWDANLESSITIIGEKGSIKVGGQYMNEVEYCHIKDYEFPELPASGPANDYGGYKGSAANHHHIIQNVVDVLKGRKTVTTNALEGLKVVEIIERIYRKARWIES
ncbi:MAG: Gfo/Idh/MocA family protein [Saprospiraceae bacterium]